MRDVYADVFSFANCGTVRLSNLYLAHAVPLEKYDCHGSVVYAKNCQSIRVSNCELNGCGAIGLSLWFCGRVFVEDSRIRNNSFNAFYISGLQSLKVIGSLIEDNGNLMQVYECDEIEMNDNKIENNGGYWSNLE
ncbi:MAG: right-handed parallel beta-helix repeat-containing protein [Planctomycetota bacterium]|nr:right-handed parallel beta-helix repeat-containing protein [Planctomycetota bacterium]